MGLLRVTLYKFIIRAYSEHWCPLPADHWMPAPADGQAQQRLSLHGLLHVPHDKLLHHNLQDSLGHQGNEEWSLYSIHFALNSFLQPDRFWNADHERVYKMLVVVMLFLSAAAILAVELYHSLYYKGKYKYFPLKATSYIQWCLQATSSRRLSITWLETGKNTLYVKLISCCSGCFSVSIIP